MEKQDSLPGGGIPHYGLAVLDPSGRYVLVWRDASKRWWFIDLWDMELFAREINKPLYWSPDANFLSQVFRRAGEVLKNIPESFEFAKDWIPLAVGGILVYLLIRR